MGKRYDLFVIGGGINGCGIARDAAGRGASVFLAEKGDFASATSSASTKLIHGGLRYLEYYEFRLVREALLEREVLLNNAPHIIWPLRFILPHHKGLRPAWFIRLGLFLYDHLGGRKLLPGTRSVKLSSGPFEEGMKPLFSKGFEYSDCWVDDARLVVLNARDAQAKGAEIRRDSEVVSARRDGDIWNVDVRCTQTGKTETIEARALVNAAGPWVADVMGEALGLNEISKVRLVKGSHIIVPKLYHHDRCFIFQNGDGRIVFSIPYEKDFTLIGTTDVDYHNDPGEVAISQDEVEYLCNAVSEYFQTPVQPKDVVRTYSGVRPLYDDGASDAKSATRDYVLEFEGGKGQAGLLNIFGGKITTYRRLAESALEKLQDYLPEGSKPWTHDASLPGGDFKPQEFDQVVDQLKNAFPFLSDSLRYRLVRSYGQDAWTMLSGCKTIEDLGRCFGADLFEKEVEWLISKEWARTSDDILWRRSKLGLRLDKTAVEALDDFIKQVA
ncbi:glycerol-3-phosphate dehydrogenase [Rhodobacteraceae bacterium RKSG542]|uniref:glycerol-3-phosphate dehydrogenase n=1 Tax=Pseudovibrio flavus TaxID=2529854 RepID=UPI0012BBCDBE|nr:glycerol-3-phosphate dehydrogenase [Pseudovibrio flavus]MTI16639.1 glycerol-3-phosphate dehydrogenase [Pseudovibrio flavus]